MNMGNVIFSYSRAQAIEDGVLVDVTEMAREAGFKFPVAVTSAVWDGYIVPDPRSVPLGQSEQGRLWDVLFVLRSYIQRSGGRATIYFPVLFIMKARKRRKFNLKAVCGPGDAGEPVITIMLPGED